MSAPLWLQNLFAYCVQITGLALAGLLLPRLLRLRTPRVLYFYWQALLAACLLLPLLESWKRLETAGGGLTTSRLRFEVAPAVAHLPGLAVAPLILMVLIGGMCLRLGWLALGLASLRRFRQTARRLAPLPQGIEELGSRLGVAPEFCLSEKIEGPVTFGLRRPVILLPPRFLDLDSDRQQVIASHELLHVVRRDWAMNLVEEIVLAAFWFHPVVWWLVGQIRLSREQVVDQQVVELTGARKPYLYALVEIAAGPGAARGLVAPAFLEESQLAERIRSLIKEDFISKRRIIISLVCVAVLTVLAGLALIRKFPLNLGSSEPEIIDAMSSVSGVTAPVAIYNPEPPANSEVLRLAEIRAYMSYWVTIGADGAVKDVTVQRSLAPGVDQYVANVIKTWKFKPAMKNGKPVACKTNLGFMYTQASAPTLKPAATPMEKPTSEVFSVGNGVSAPVAIFKPEPPYTDAARRAKLQGTSVLWTIIGADGAVKDVRIVKSLDPGLDQSAVNTIKTWKFKPATKDGTPVACKVSVEVSFKLF